MNVTIRDARDGDGGALISLIAACYAEYPGCVLDVQGESSELLAIATYHAEHDGRFWVAELGQSVVGSVGLVTARAGVELKKLYVRRDARRRGLAARLCDLVESEARVRDAPFVELSSDIRFRDAHRLHQRRGYVRGPVTRELHDLSRSEEYYFHKEL